MDGRKWDEIFQAIEAYRACAQQEQFESLCRALDDCTLYVPVGDFDGNNAVISPLTSVQGGSFIPLYASRENVRPAQPSEGVRPADWQHILNQLPNIDGCVFEPYSVNFSFDRRFLDVLVKTAAGAGSANESAPRASVEREVESFADNHASYVPSEQIVQETAQEKKDYSGQSHGFFRRLFKRID